MIDVFGIKVIRKITLILLGFILSYDAHCQFINQGSTVILNSESKFVVNGDFKNLSGGKVVLKTNSALQVKEDLLNYESLILEVGAQLEFFGSQNSNFLSNDALIQNFNINKMDSEVFLLDPLSINETLNFISDNSHLVLNGFDLNLKTSALITSYDENKYIVTGHDKVIKDDLTSFYFPVGYDLNTYNPINVEQNGLIDDIGVSVLEDAYDDGTSSGNQLLDDVVNATWQLTESTPGGSDIILIVEWDSNDESGSFNRDLCAIARYEGIEYDIDFGDLGLSSGSDPYNRANFGFNELGSFVVGDQGLIPVTLPVELLNFNVVKSNEKNAIVSWNVEEEYDLAHYEILKSADGVHFNLLENIAKANNSSLSNEYVYEDQNACSDCNNDNILFYKLKMIDLDGQVNFGPIKSVLFENLKTDNGVSVFPNPFNRNIKISGIADDTEIKLFNFQGKLVFDGTDIEENEQIDLLDIPAGSYILRLKSSNNSIAIKLIKN